MRVYHSREIAENMGVSYQTVCTWAKRAGLQLPLSAKELKQLKRFYQNNKSIKTSKGNP